MTKKKLTSFEKAYRSARDAGVRYFYWAGKDGVEKKYTTRDINEDPDENVYDDKKKYPDRNKTSGVKKDPKVLDYVPQTMRKKGGKLYKKGGNKMMYKKGGKKKQMGGFLLEPPIEQI
tara:strand:+ start:603 stop:956 length:354 start_codon:yes stop_codon:yes gene_type:complete